MSDEPIKIVKVISEGMSEPFWRDLWMKELESRFGRFLKANGAKMLEGANE